MLTVVAFSVLPFAGFLNENRRQSVGVGTVLPYVLIVALPAILVVLVVNWRKGREAADRAAVIVAAGLFAFFNFHNLGTVLRRIALNGHDLEIWAVIFLVVIALAYVLAKQTLVRRYVLVAGLLLVAIPVVQYVSFRLTASDGSEVVSRVDVPAEAGSASAAGRPNVYFFVLDGYGRDDQLLKQLDFDNSAFTDALSQRGFDVAERSYASYAPTYLSISSTLEMDYVVAEGGEVSADRDRFYRKLRGENKTVRDFRAVGYRYAVAPPGFWPGTQCSDVEDLCIEPLDGPGLLGGLEETDWAVMTLTPLATAARRWIPDASAGPYNEPGHMLDVLEKDRPREPYFVFSHMMNPHPPYRYHPDCSPRDVKSGLDSWDRGPYLDMLKCANKLMLPAVDRIVRRDPGAIIIIQGDHGTAFTVDPGQAVDDWSTEEVHERYSPLNAIRLPERCRQSLDDARPLINTFRTVFACIRGEKPDPLPFEAYLTDENSGEVKGVSDKLPASSPAP